jgi:hypothetical protein
MYPTEFLNAVLNNFTTEETTKSATAVVIPYICGVYMYKGILSVIISQITDKDLSRTHKDHRYKNQSVPNTSHANADALKYIAETGRLFKPESPKM